MLTIAWKRISSRSIALIIPLSLLAGAPTVHGAATKPAKGALKNPARKKSQSPPPQVQPAPIKEWGPYLDVAYELTYWDKGEIREWREKREQEIGETLAVYVAAWNDKLAPTLSEGTASRKDERQPIYRERDYLRQAIAQTVDFLQNGNRSSLNSAERYLDKLKAKAAMPEIAYWTGYVKALQAIENKDSREFVARVFDVWNSAVVYFEEGDMGNRPTKGEGESAAPFYYRNIVNLVANRAIIDQKLEDLSALGPLFLMLNDRNLAEKKNEGEYLTTLVRRIAEGLNAPDADRCRLNFVVAAIEAKRLQQACAAKLDSQGMTEEARKLFEESRLFSDYAIKWAASKRSSGVVMVLTDNLDFTSFAIQRLADNEKAPAYKFFSSLPAADAMPTLTKGMDAFSDIASFSKGEWEKGGYADRESYLKATHRLWRAIMELSLWTGDFYFTRLNAADEPRSIIRSATTMQGVLDAYLDFLAAQMSRKLPDVIPDFAYFGASEAAEKLAHAYLKVNSFSTDNTAYDLWFLHHLQAAELFPFAPREIVQTAALLRRDGRFNLYLDYFLPLADRFKQSAAVRKWLDEQKSDQAAVIRSYADSITEVFAEMPADSGATPGKTSLASYAESFRLLREELQRKPDHPVHKLLRAFYMEELQKGTPYALLLKDSNPLGHGM